MGRSKRTRKWKKPEEDQKERVYEEPDPNADDYFHDVVDKFHTEREKILLESTSYNKDKQEQSGDENYQDEEVMTLDIEDSSDDDDDDDDNDDDDDDEEVDNNEDDVNDKDSSADEELDEEEEGSESERDGTGIPSVKSWGKKKSTFYHGYIAEEYAGSDEEMDKLAEEEEEEALALQKHMAASFEEQDFDVDVFEVSQMSQKKVKGEDLNKERIIQDLSKLSRAEKFQILMKDSPELFHLMDEFKLKLKEVTERLHPLVKMARAGQIPKEGASYLELKHQLYLNYCINIGFYLLLKAKKMPVRDHPVMGRLVQYKKLITELKPLDEKLKPEVEILLSQSQTPVQNGSQEESDLQGVKSKEKRKVNGKKKEKERKRKGESDPAMMDPLEYYEAVKLAKKRKKEAKQAASRSAREQWGEVDEEDMEEGKRAIPYEISQNKGLKAKRKKELRNPRVKHRKKYEKARIKRKSQVLPVLNEQNRYGGEMSGIRSHLTRSIKLK